MMPKWEAREYFKEYMEDYNTGTLKSHKYVNFAKWEMEDYECKFLCGS